MQVAAEATKAARVVSRVVDAEAPGETGDYTRGSVMILWQFRFMMPWRHQHHPILLKRMLILLGMLLTMLARRSLHHID